MVQLCKGTLKDVVDVLTQQEADALIEIIKNIRDTNVTFSFPITGDYKKIDLDSADGKQSFIVDVNRKGCVNLIKKCTYQGRYQRDTPLLRLDVGGADHMNPDGQIIRGNHLHIYREGYGDSFAIVAPPDISNADDLFQTLIDFLVYFKTANARFLEIEVVI